MRRRLLFGKNLNIVENSTATLGDLIVYDTDTLKQYICNVLICGNLPLNIHPVGLVVIPSNHGMYSSFSTCGVMALKSASMSSPVGGSTTNEKMEWGYPDADYKGLVFHNLLPSYGTIATNLLNIFKGFGTKGYLSSDKIYNDFLKDMITDRNVQFICAYYEDSENPDSVLIANPYTYTESSNINYTKQPTADTGLYNAFTPFNGYNYSNILCSASSNTSWKTSSTVPNYSYEVGNHPAARACYRYLVGINNWYLPSLGELGYIFNRFIEFNNYLDIIKEVNLPLFKVCPLIGDIYVSSTPKSMTAGGIIPNCINFYNGDVMVNTNNLADEKIFCVRPFTNIRVTERITL